MAQNYPLKVGSKQHTYLWENNFFKLPQSIQIEKNTHGVTVDKQGRIFIHSESQHAVMIFDQEGHFIKSWGSSLQKGAHGMDLRIEDNTEFLYFAATELNVIVKTTLDGEEVWRIGYPKESGLYMEAIQYVPTNVAFAPNGDFYVADGYGLFYIHQYDNQGNYIRSWGGKGSEPGKLDYPHGIWVDTRGQEPVILVADRANRRIQRFTLEGTHIDFITEELRFPCHFDQRGNELLIPDLEGRITIFDQNNKLLVHLGDNPDPLKRAKNDTPRDKWIDGTFISPHDACWDAQGNIIVAEWLEDGGRLTFLRKVN